MPSPARRLWILPDCPPDLVAGAPPGYGAGCCALVYGGTPNDEPPVAWATALPETVGLQTSVAPTFALRSAPTFLWTCYFDPTGQVEPAGLLPPPPPEPEVLPEDP